MGLGRLCSPIANQLEQRGQDALAIMRRFWSGAAHLAEAPGCSAPWCGDPKTIWKSFSATGPCQVLIFIFELISFEPIFPT